MDIWDLLIEGHSSHVFPAQFLGHEYCMDLPFPFCNFNFFVHFFVSRIHHLSSVLMAQLEHLMITKLKKEEMVYGV
jgi:hypothetical protein